MENKNTIIVDESLGYKVLFYNGLPLTAAETNGVLALLAQELFTDVDSYHVPHYQSVTEVTARVREISTGKVSMSVLNNDKRIYLIGKAKEFLLIQKHLNKGFLPFPAYTLDLKEVGPFCYSSINAIFTSTLKTPRLKQYFDMLGLVSDKVSAFRQSELSQKANKWLPSTPDVITMVHPELGYPIYFLKTNMPSNIQERLLQVLYSEEVEAVKVHCARKAYPIAQHRMELSLAIHQLLEHKAIMLTPVLDGCEVQTQFCGPKYCTPRWWQSAGVLPNDEGDPIEKLQAELCKRLQDKQDHICRKTVTLYGEMVWEPIFFMPISMFDYLPKDQTPIYQRCMQKLEELCFPTEIRNPNQVKVHCTCLQQLFTNHAIPLNLPCVDKEKMDELFSMLRAEDHQLANTICADNNLAPYWYKMGRPFRMKVEVDVDNSIEPGCTVQLNLSMVKFDQQLDKDSLLAHMASSNHYDHDTFTVLAVNGDTCMLDRFLTNLQIPTKYVVRVR